MNLYVVLCALCFVLFEILIWLVFVQDDGANAVAVSAEQVQSKNTYEDIYMLFYVRCV